MELVKLVYVRTHVQKDIMKKLKTENVKNVHKTVKLVIMVLDLLKENVNLVKKIVIVNSDKNVIHILKDVPMKKLSVKETKSN